jgi:hypothetical protein
MYVFHMFSACVLDLMMHFECILPFQDIFIIFKLRHSAVLMFCVNLCLKGWMLCELISELKVLFVYIQFLILPCIPYWLGKWKSVVTWLLVVILVFIFMVEKIGWKQWWRGPKLLVLDCNCYPWKSSTLRFEICKRGIERRWCLSAVVFYVNW